MPMTEKLIKKSKFSFYAFGDSVSENDFIGENFTVRVESNTVFFCLKLSKDLDYISFEKCKGVFDTFVFEESYVCNKIKLFLAKHKHFKSFRFRFETPNFIEYHLTNIKVDSKAVYFKSFH